MTGALIVGGGLAGAAVAIRLAQAGRSVVLLERESGPHDKVCGEFLSREAVLYLQALGLDPARLGGVAIDRLALASGDRVGAVALPFAGSSLSRRVLDEALLGCAAAAGVEIRRGARVCALERDGAAWRARLGDGESVAADAAFLACGKHDLKGWGRGPGLQNDLIGLKQYVRLAPPQALALASRVELMLFRGGYAGLEPVEDGRANLCLLVRKRRFAALGNDWRALLTQIRSECALLDRRLAGAVPCADRPLAIAAIPYGYVARPEDGLWRLGDQAAVIPSFAGDGMSIALHSAALAAAHFLAGATPQCYARRLARDVGPSVRAAALLSLAATTAPGRGLISYGASALPWLMAAVASATRVPPAALRRAGLAGI
jgi:flavin-dependent dehydrogenase